MRAMLCVLAACLLGSCLSRGAPHREDAPAYRVETSVPTMAGYSLVWNDEFEVDGPPDSSRWNFEHGFCRNQELQWYQAENAVCRGGLLIIEGRRGQVRNPHFDPKSDDWKKRREYAQYTSASL